MSDRPAVGRPTYDVYVALEGTLQETGGVDEKGVVLSSRLYATAIETNLSDTDPTVIEFQAPTQFAAWRLRAQCVRRGGNEDNETKLAQTVVNMVPRDVWDACLAALDTGTDDGKATCYQMLLDWIAG